ncbi:tRNA-dihydrouridine synthase [Candidatus Enterovibrio altilux]|uniref:tRNA-dihydrouridine synthase n=1 Tax=Candidatus Enterovibrio altilux TaxID=1927128 RepID=UPI001CC260FF|nr:tRNA-dihydrouridine synthase [Candidatus Enterovibrio luxaltus]
MSEELTAPLKNKIQVIMLSHIQELHQFYGEFKGLHIARKYVGWCLEEYVLFNDFRRTFNAIKDAHQPIDAL